MSLFISDAVAATADASQSQTGGLSMLVMPLIFLFIFYFMLWRPQSKRAKEQRELVDGIQKGDEIVTTGGMLGKVSEISDKFLTVTIAPNTTINMQRNAVSTVLPKGTIKTI